MPLSRGRDARPPRPAAPPARPRLRPGRHDDPPDRPHRPARRRGDHRGVRRAGGRPDHLRLGRQGAGRPRRAGSVISPTIDEVVRDAPADIAVVKQRGTQGHPADRRPGPRRPPRRARASATPTRSPAATTRRSASSTSSRPGITLAVRAQAEHALAQFVRQHLKGRGEGIVREAANVRNAILREAERADLVVMGASAQPAGTDGETLPVRRPARGDRRPGPSRRVIVVKTREVDRPGDVRAARRRGPRRSPPPTAPPRRPAPSRPGSSAGSASRTSTTPSSPTCAASSSSRRSRASRSRSSCRRSTRRRRSGRSSGARCAR